jgi:hypothetical protein
MVYHSEIQFLTDCRSALQRSTVYCNVSQCAAVGHSTVQYSVVYYSVSQYFTVPLCIAISFIGLQGIPMYLRVSQCDRMFGSVS